MFVIIIKERQLVATTESESSLVPLPEVLSADPRRTSSRRFGSPTARSRRAVPAEGGRRPILRCEEHTCPVCTVWSGNLCGRFGKIFSQSSTVRLAALQLLCSPTSIVTFKKHITKLSTEVAALAYPEYRYVKKSLRIGCVITHCNLQHGITQPILRSF